MLLRVGHAGRRRRPGDVVVARLPDDRVVVRQHTQRMRRLAALRVHVVDVGAEAVRGERVLVVVDVERAVLARIRGEVRVALVVLVGEDEHAVTRVRALVVRERLRAGVALLRLEPDRHLVPGFGVGDLRAQPVVPVVALVAVALAAVPLLGGQRARRAAVDPVLRDHGAQVAARVDLDGLRRAEGDRELVGLQTRQRVVLPRGRPRAVAGGARHVERELHVALELGLHVGLDVLEDEAGARAGARRALGGHRDRLVGPVEVVVHVAVRRVEIGADLRVERRDGRVALHAGDAAEDRLVGGVRVHLPAEGIEQQPAPGVVVLVEREVHAVGQVVDGLRLRLGAGRRAAVGLARGVVARALVVVAPVRVQIAVRVDAVARVADHAVAVVVAQVLAPEAVLRRERVVVAVRVDDEDEPQLARVDELGQLLGGDALDGLAVRTDRGALAAVVVEEQPQLAPVGLAREPLARVLHARVEHRGARAVLVLLRVLGHSHRVDRLLLMGRADLLQVGELGVLLLELLHLRDEVVLRVARVAAQRDVGAQVRPPDLPARLRGHVRAQRGPAALGAGQPRAHALLAQLARLRGRGDDLDRAALAALRDVEALPGERLDGVARLLELDLVRVEALGLCARRHGERDRGSRRKRDAP